MARKLILAVGLLLLLFGGAFWWRVTHPPLTDDQQISANLVGIEDSVKSGSADGVLNYFAEDGKWNGLKRSELRSRLFGAFYEGLRRRQIDFSITNAQTSIQGNHATTNGHFSASFQEGRGTPTVFSGEFTAEWVKRDGNWVIVNGNGGPNL